MNGMLTSYNLAEKNWEVTIDRETLKDLIRARLKDRVDVGEAFTLKIRDEHNTIKSVGKCWIFEVGSEQ